MKWREFKEAVYDLITVDASRIGVEAFIDRQIGLAVGDLQHYIEAYRQGHETTFDVEDATDEGFASTVNLPDGIYLREAYHVKVGNSCVSRVLSKYPYSNRRDLVCGVVGIGCSGGNFQFAIDPGITKMWIYPRLVDGYRVVLVWDGKKFVFDDEDIVPFDLQAALAVAEWVKAKIAREVDRDVKLAASYMADYTAGRSRIYREVLERTRLKDVPSDARCVPGNANGGGSCYNQTQRLPCDCQPVIYVQDLAGNVASCCNTITVPETEWVFIGESGDPSYAFGTPAVATTIKAVNPEFIIHAGDANFPAGSPVTLNANFASQYYSFLQANAYAAFGPVDLATGYGSALLGALPDVQTILTNQGQSSTQLYYHFAQGPVRFFVLNSGTSESDTTANFAAQITWLNTNVPLYFEPFKIVIIARPPYSSDPAAVTANTFRLDYHSLGIDLVVSSGSKMYEKLFVNNQQYVVCGLGGSLPAQLPTSPQSSSQLILSGFNGFLQCQAIASANTLPNKLLVSLVDTNGTTRDQIIIEK